MSGNGIIIVSANNNQAKTELNMCNRIAEKEANDEKHYYLGYGFTVLDLWLFENKIEI